MAASGDVISEVQVIGRADARQTAIAPLDPTAELANEIHYEDLRVEYVEMVRSMSKESAHLPVKTGVRRMVERIAKTYVMMIQMERDGQFKNATEHQRYVEFWMRMSNQFYTLLRQSSPTEQQEALKTRVVSVIVSVLKDIRDPGLRNDLIGKFNTAFKEAGL